MQLNLRAFAKINLTLDVFSKRPDGYHGIASVMQAISLHDTIRMVLRDEPGVQFTCDGPEAAGIPIDDSNLVVRAAAAVIVAARESRGSSVKSGVAIHLNKVTPSQAGLGGGSSDAAATVVGVNELFGLNLPPSKLHEIAASIGSDVPYFLLGGTAVARGRGEVLSPSKDAPRFWLVVVKPDENVSTAWAYGELDSMPDRSSHRGTKRMEQAIEEGDYDLVLARMCNDFELPVFSRYPRLAWLHDELRMAGARTAGLCGSGSAIFGVAGSEAEARNIAAMLQSRYPGVSVAHTLTREESQLRYDDTSARGAL